MRLKIGSGLFFLVLLIILSCSGRPGGEEITVKIIMTSDVHGLVFPYDFANDVPAGGSLARVQSFVRDERRKADQHVVLLDNGDILQGQPLAYYFNFESDREQHLIPAAMNFMGYDAATIGNHDIEAGAEVYDRIVDESAFPWLAANAVRRDSGRPYFKPYTIVETGGVSIAVIGLTTPMVTQWLPEVLWKDMEFGGMLPVARKWVDIVLEVESPDLVVLLIHEDPGISVDENGKVTGTVDWGAAQLATEITGVDVILTGHDHRLWNLSVAGPENDPVLLVGPGSHARHVAVVTATFVPGKQSGRYEKSLKGEIVSMDGIEPDPEFMARFGQQKMEVEEYVSRPLGKVTETFSSRESLFGSSSFVDITHRLQLELSGAEISFAAPLSYDASISRGDIRVRDLFNLYRFENYLYTMELTGEEIVGFLEYSYGLWFNTMTSAGDPLLRYRTDAAGNPFILDDGETYTLAEPVFNFDSAAGIDYIVDVTRPAGERVRVISMTDGSPFSPRGTYRVAINSYRGSGGGGHLVEGAGIPASQLNERIISSTSRDLRHYLMERIEQQGVVEAAPINNWKVVPEEWVSAAMVREMEWLFGN